MLLPTDYVRKHPSPRPPRAPARCRGVRTSTPPTPWCPPRTTRAAFYVALSRGRDANTLPPLAAPRTLSRAASPAPCTAIPAPRLHARISGHVSLLRWRRWSSSTSYTPVRMYAGSPIA